MMYYYKINIRFNVMTPAGDEMGTVSELHSGKCSTSVLMSRIGVNVPDVIALHRGVNASKQRWCQDACPACHGATAEWHSVTASCHRKVPEHYLCARRTV